MKIEFKKRTEGYLERLPKQHRARILKAIYKLPYGDVVPLQGVQSAFRLRVGDWRVVYEISDGKIIIRKIGNRGDIYK